MIKALKTILFYLAIVLLYSSCQEKMSYKLSPISITVDKSSGEDYRYMNSDFIPIPVNVGRIKKDGKSIVTFILSKKVEEGTEIGIMPFLEMEFRDSEGKESLIVLSLPSDEKLRLSNKDGQQIEGDKLYAAIHIVEYWYINRDGLNGKHKISERSVTYDDYIK